MNIVPTNGPLSIVDSSSRSASYYAPTGSGGGPSTVVSSFTFLSAQTAQISTLNVSTLNAVNGLSTSTLNVSSINSAPATKAWFGTNEIGNLSPGVSEEVLPFSFSSIDSFCATANYSYNSAPTTALSSLYTYPSTVSSFLVRGQDTLAYAWTVVGV